MSNVALLAVRADGTYVPFSAAAWSEAGKMTFMGMLMVFSVLAILWGVLAIFKMVFAGKTPKVKAVKAAPTPVNVEEKVEAAVQNTSNDELIAVLTAAVAAYMAEENGGEASTEGFRVVSFRRVGGGRAWNSK
ncbi:MAG: OadG family protein [Clostridia bacterium]|nr:OadG family protein [Clostridia bacterium]